MLEEKDKRLHCFNTEDEFDAIYNGSAYTRPWASFVRETSGVSYSKDEVFNDYGYVDLGLPSGILWAETDLCANSVEEIGGLFAWGEIEPRESEVWLPDNYKWGGGSNTAVTKYNDQDLIETLLPEDDAAHMIMRGKWQMPTRDDILELIANTNKPIMDYEINSSYAVYKIMSKNNENCLRFMSPSNVNHYGFYIWSSTVYSQSGYKYMAYSLGNAPKSETYKYVITNKARYGGCRIRGVVRPNN